MSNHKRGRMFFRQFPKSTDSDIPVPPEQQGIFYWGPQVSDEAVPKIKMSKASTSHARRFLPSMDMVEELLQDRLRLQQEVESLRQERAVLETLYQQVLQDYSRQNFHWQASRAG